MQTLIIKTESKATANLLIAFLKTVRLVKSIALAPNDTKVGVVNEPTTEYNWTNPSRPATEEEIEQMLNECEEEIELGLGIGAETARKQTMEEIKQWRKQRK